jgi:indole-3-glycerol phosphate synthase
VRKKQTMNILTKITAHKRTEVEVRKQAVSIKKLEASPLFNRQPFLATTFIKERTGIIAEFKRQSPSKGVIHPNADIETITKGYVSAGVSAISILTDVNFFGGSDADFLAARSFNDVPLLRKDFMIDEYQIIEAKAIGADFILLIAACLSPKEIQHFGKLAQSLGMQVLLEVHNQAELERSLCPFVDLVGVNNRDLTTFTLDLQHSYNLVNQIPNDFLKISESGISNPKTIVELRQAGFDGFLIGENFMKTSEPGEACLEFIGEINFHDHLKDGHE